MIHPVDASTITVYNWPSQASPDIFSFNSSNQFFAYTMSGVSRLGAPEQYSCEIILNNNEFCHAIPFAYTTLSVFERLAIYRNGNLIFDNFSRFNLKNLTDEAIREKYYTHFIADSNQQGYLVTSPRQIISLILPSPMAQEEAHDQAIHYSKSCHTYCLVAKKWFEMDWR